MKRCRWFVIYGQESHVARFSEFDGACAFAREESRPCYLVEVRAHDGIVAQFKSGLLTEEFKHLNQE